MSISMPVRTSHESTIRPPPLQAGDRLDQPTFHARYSAMPPRFRAELLQGVVVVPSPVGFGHSEVHGNVMTWLGVYKLETPGVKVLDNVTAILGPETEVQPDAVLFLPPEAGGRVRLAPVGIAGPPDLAVEIAHSSASYDLGPKKREYERHGVAEYVVVVAMEDEVKWFRRQGETFVEVEPDRDGVYRSSAFPGLWLNAPALVADNLREVMTTLRLGLATPEHAEFVARLQRAREAV